MLKMFMTLCCLMILSGSAYAENVCNKVNIDNDTLNKIDKIIKEQVVTHHRDHQGGIIEKVSAQFLGTPYVANRLIGSESKPEELVIDFRGVDCFTYLDYVASLSRSTDLCDFVNNLITTRYVDGHIDFLNRKHFFTDWSNRPSRNAIDITAQLTPEHVTITKYLNQKVDGGVFIPGLPVVTRTFSYIPASSINDKVIHHLKTGDYIGIYTPIQGLDVTHTGIFILTPQGPMFRNASSRKENMKVVDSPFVQYVSTTPGIVVLRAQ